MNIEGSVAFVTGANRGLGKAYAEALLKAGAAKVYAGAMLLIDKRAEDTRAALRNDPAAFAVEMQRLWDAGPRWAA